MTLIYTITNISPSDLAKGQHGHDSYQHVYRIQMILAQV